MPPQKSTLLRVAAPLLVALVLALVATPASPATAAKRPVARVAVAAPSGQGTLNLGSDVVQPAASGRVRRASFAWTGRRILYTESIPSKWDWSLSTALAKWNSTGGGIKFVRATSPRKARLTISYGNIGGAAGLATVGRSRHASVRLSSAFSSQNALDARTRVQVLGIFTHELGHVLGFQHTQARCSLMSPVLDVDGCNVLPVSLPGYYMCRTIDGPLATRFVKVYGGHARYPGAYCPIDPLPTPVSGVAFVGGVRQLGALLGDQAAPATETRSPVTITWARPSAAPAGSHIVIRSWTANACAAVPGWATTSYASATAGVWRDPQTDVSGSTCYHVQLVNRYGAGRSPVSHLVAF